MNIIIIAWVNVALISIFEGFFDLPKSDALLYTAIVMLIATVYASLSGLLGVALTDALQFIMALTGCIILAFLVLNSDKIGGITRLKHNCPPKPFSSSPISEQKEAALLWQSAWGLSLLSSVSNGGQVRIPGQNPEAVVMWRNE